MRRLFVSANFDAAAQAYDEAPARTQSPDAHILRARIYLKKDPPRAIELLLRLQARAQLTPRAEVAMLLGMAYGVTGQFDASTLHFSRAAQLLEASPHALLSTELAYRRGRCRLMASSIADARNDLELLRRQHGETASILSLHLESSIHGHESRFKQQADTLVRLLELLDRSSAPDVEIWAWSIHTLAALCRELWMPDAVDLVETQVTRCPWTSDLRINQYQAVKALGWCHALRGDYFNAFRLLKRARDIAPSAGWQTMATCDRAYLARCINEPRWSRQELDEAENLAQAVDWRSMQDEERVAFILLAELLAGLDPSRAAAYMAQYSSLGRLNAPLLHFTYDDRLDAITAYVQGIVHIALGNSKQGLTLLREALATFDRVGYEWRAGRCALRLYETTSDEQYLALAEERLKNYAASWLGNELRQLRNHRAADAVRLTPVQERVFKLICAGKSTREIAGSLERSPFTVRNHMKLIFKAYKVKSRSALLVEAAKRNII